MKIIGKPAPKTELFFLSFSGNSLREMNRLILRPWFRLNFKATTWLHLILLVSIILHSIYFCDLLVGNKHVEKVTLNQ